MVVATHLERERLVGANGVERVSEAVEGCEQKCARPGDTTDGPDEVSRPLIGVKFLRGETKERGIDRLRGGQKVHPIPHGDVEKAGEGSGDEDRLIDEDLDVARLKFSVVFEGLPVDDRPGVAMEFKSEIGSVEGDAEIAMATAEKLARLCRRGKAAQQKGNKQGSWRRSAYAKGAGETRGWGGKHRGTPQVVQEQQQQQICEMNNNEDVYDLQ